jgi:hypothetical protein
MSGGAGGGAEMSMGGAGGSEDPAPAGGGEFKLMTTSFTDGDVLPDKFTCAVLSGLGPGAIPELSWGDPPEGTKSFGLTFVDTKIAPTSPAMGYHWAMYDISVDAREIPEGELSNPMGDLSGSQQYNPLPNNTGFLGPCPTMGPDDYAFTLYALDVATLAEASMSNMVPKNVQQISDLMEMHMIAKTALTCTSNAKAGSAQ